MKGESEQDKDNSRIEKFSNSHFLPEIHFLFLCCRLSKIEMFCYRLSKIEMLCCRLSKIEMFCYRLSKIEMFFRARTLQRRPTVIFSNLRVVPTIRFRLLSFIFFICFLYLSFLLLLIRSFIFSNLRVVSTIRFYQTLSSLVRQLSGRVAKCHRFHECRNVVKIYKKQSSPHLFFMSFPCQAFLVVTFLQLSFSVPSTNSNNQI